MPSEAARWVFAYGSLVWRPDFDYLEVLPATANGWARRFWQGSPDHRGTPDHPGRVVTLIPRFQSRTSGVAYRLNNATAASTLAALDVREQGGYSRKTLTVEHNSGRRLQATSWVGEPDNPAYLGPTSYPAMARHIREANGPSGSNLEYFQRLCAAVDDLGVDDPHLRRIARWLPDN